MGQTSETSWLGKGQRKFFTRLGLHSSVERRDDGGFVKQLDIDDTDEDNRHDMPFKKQPEMSSHHPAAAAEANWSGGEN